MSVFVRPSFRIDARQLLPVGDVRRLLRVDRSREPIEICPVLRGEDATHQSVLLESSHPFICHLNEHDRIVSEAIALYRYWEAAESLVLTTTVKPGMSVIDAGANVGWHTILLAQCVGQRGRVYAFEPEPNNFLVLSANAWIASQRQTETIHIAPVALGRQREPLRLNLYPGNLGYHSTVVAESWSYGTIEVVSWLLDDLRFGIDGLPPEIDRRIDLIKADIQGGELELIQGAKRVLAEDRPVLCLELEPSVTGVERALALLDELLALNYGRMRLFTANETGPAAILNELSTWLPPLAIQARIRGQQIGPYGTLWAEFDDA